MIFFLTLTVRGPFIWRVLSEKKYRGMGLIFEKPEALYEELHKRPEAGTSSYSATGDFLEYIYSVLVAKNHQKIQFRCLVHEFSFTDVFLMIFIMVTEQLYWRKSLVVASVLYGCGSFLLLWKIALNDADCTCILPPYHDL